MTTPDIDNVLEGHKKSRKRSKVIWFVMMITLVVAVVGLPMFLRIRAAGDGPKFVTETAKRGDLKVSIVATGTVEAKTTVDVGSEVTGKVLEVTVDYNDKVEPGQVLARIDPVQFQLDVEEADAGLVSSKANLLHAKATMTEAEAARQRTEALAKEGLVSKQDLDSARATAQRAQADIATAKAAVVKAEAAVHSMKTRLEKTTIISPIKGIVLDKQVEVGQTLTAGFQTPIMFTLAEDLSAMEVEAAVDEADVGGVKKDLSATFTVDAYPNRVFQSKVKSVRNVAVVESNVVTYEAVLEAENKDLALRPGMTATATIVTTTVNNAILVPNAAIRFKMPQPKDAPDGEDSAGKSGRRGGGLSFMMDPPRPSGGDKKPVVGPDPTRSTVYTMVDGHPVQHMVKTGPTDGDFTVIEEGDIAEGDLLVTDSETHTEK